MTINAQFEINPSRNGGLSYKYDEVVRGKRDRRQMEAGDCECCRDVCLILFLQLTVKVLMFVSITKP